MKYLIVLGGLALAGCASTPPVQVRGDNYCRLAGTISWSVADTKDTLDQVRVSNAKYRRVCRRHK